MLSPSVRWSSGDLEFALAARRWHREPDRRSLQRRALSDAVARLGDALPADAALLVPRFPSSAADPRIISVGLQDARNGVSRTRSRPAPAGFLACLAEDSRLLARTLALAPGEPLVLSQILSDDEFTATRLYRKWLRPHGLRHLMVLVVRRKATQRSVLALLRRPGSTGFHAGELDRLRALSPQLQRVLQLQDRMEEMDKEREVANRVLESLGCGSLLLDEAGRVCRANRRALALCGAVPP